MSDQVFFIIHNDKSDIKVYQSEYTSDFEVHPQQNNNICLKCGNDHSFNGNHKKERTIFDIFQDLIDNYNKNQKLENKKQMVVQNG